MTTCARRLLLLLALAVPDSAYARTPEECREMRRTCEGLARMCQLGSTAACRAMRNCYAAHRKECGS